MKVHQFSSSHRIFMALTLGLGLTVGLIALLGLNLNAIVYAQTLTVTTTADTFDGVCDTDCSLRDAIATANSIPGSDVIILEAGTYGLSITGTDDNAGLTGDLDVVDALGTLEIRGAGMMSTTIDANSIDRVFDVLAGNVVFSDLSIVGGMAPQGAGVRIVSGVLTTTPTSVSLNQVMVAGNAALGTVPTPVPDGGGGILNLGGRLSVFESMVVNNQAILAGGGVLNLLGQATISQTLVADNVAQTGSAGGLGNGGGGVMMVYQTLISNNEALDPLYEGAFIGIGDGGGVANQFPSQITLIETDLINNFAHRTGGGIVNDGFVTISQARIEGNETIWGGGGVAHAISGSMQIDTSEIRGNFSQTRGGGVGNQGLMTMTNSLVENNYANTHGGGIYNGWRGMARLTLVNTPVISNQAVEDAGGIWNGDSLTLLENSHILSNTAGDDGGGLDTEGVSNLSSIIIAGNHANDTGGGMRSYLTSTIIGGIIENNTAGNTGGGLQILSGTFTLSNTTLINNQALQGGGLHYQGTNASETSRMVNVLLAGNQATVQGAAIGINTPGQLEILHTTIADVEQNLFSAIAAQAGTVGISNSIIASHTVALYSNGGAIYEDYNLFAFNSTAQSGTVNLPGGQLLPGITNGGNSLLEGDPAFADPVANDYRLTSGSAAIDAGINLGVASDFEGDTRPQGSGPDLGYDESPPSVVQWQINIINPVDNQVFTSTTGTNATVSVMVSTGDFTVPDDGYWMIEANGSTMGPISDYFTTLELPVGTHTLTATLYTAAGASTGLSDSVSIEVVAESVGVCTQVSQVQLTVDNQGTGTFVNTAAAFSVDILPDTASKPYSYTLTYGDGQQDSGSSSADPLQFSHSYTQTGQYNVEVALWNCDMTTPITDSLQLEVIEASQPMFYLYLPLVVK